MKRCCLLVVVLALAGCQALAGYNSGERFDGSASRFDISADADGGDGSGGEVIKADVQPVQRPFDIDTIRTKLAELKVTCPGTEIAATDDASDTTAFLLGGSELPADTLAWLAGAQPVGLGWNPKGCDELGPEDPDCDGQGTDTDWSSAGLLIRGAGFQSQDVITLPSNLTMADINLIDVNWSPVVFKCEFAGADDSELAAPPFVQLLAPTVAVKTMLVQLARGQ